jgi:hypothetical protein
MKQHYDIPSGETILQPTNHPYILVTPTIAERSTCRRPQTKPWKHRCTEGLRLPPLWPDRPALSFAQAEAQFEIAGITRQRSKINHVVSQLHQQHADVEYITTGPPEEVAYNHLKEEVRRLSTSREQRVRQLLSHEEMGDRKPSEFLRHMKRLPNDFLRTICDSRLPPHMEAILAAQTEGSLDPASHLTDRICEVTPHPTTVATCEVAPLPATANISPFTPDDVSRLLDRMAQLTRQVTALHKSHAREHTRPSSRSSDRRRNTTPQNSPSRQAMCWCHRCFGDNARKCNPRCSHQQGKLQQQPLMTANDCNTSTTSRLFVTDRVRKLRYLVDTGPDLCVFPRKLYPRRRECTDYNP